MHHTMSAEAVGQEKTWNLAYWSKDAVVVRRHFVKPSPCPLGVYWEIFEDWHAISGQNQDFLYK